MIKTRSEKGASLTDTIKIESKSMKSNLILDREEKNYTVCSVLSFYAGGLCIFCGMKFNKKDHYTRLNNSVPFFPIAH